MNEEDLLKTIMKCTPEGKREHGRPRLWWWNPRRWESTKLRLRVGKSGGKSWGKLRPTVGCGATDDDEVFVFTWTLLLVQIPHFSSVYK